MNKEQYKRIRNLVNKLKSQADSEGFTVVEFDLLLTKFLPTQGYSLADWKKAEKKWENKIEVDYSNTPSIFVGERGPEGPKGRDSTIPGPMGPAIPGPRGKKGDRGPQGKTGTITTEDFNRLRERLYAEQLKPADLDKKLNERFDGINKKLTQFITTSVLEPSIKAIVTPELNRYLRSIQSTAYTALLEAKKAAGGTVTEVSVVTANGVSGTVATATTTPAITLTLGAITPSSVTVSGLTASELVATDASKVLQSLAVATYPSLTELTYVKGVTSAIQTQFTGKAATDQTMYIGTTAVAINRATAPLTLAGLTLTTPDIGTPSAGTLTNCTALPVAGIVASTVTALGVGSIELGHASDTSITRVSAGVIAVEGVNVVLSTVTSLGSLTTAAVLPWTGMKPGTDGEIPTFDASGNPAFVAVGTATHVLTSNGVGAAPTFQAAAGGTSPTLLVWGLPGHGWVNAGGSAEVGENVINGALEATLADAIADARWDVMISVPVGATSISSMKLYYVRQSTGNVRLRFVTSHTDTDTVNSTRESDTTDVMTAYAGGAADNTIGQITVPAGAYNGLTGIDVDDLIGIGVYRESNHADDTYNAGFNIVGVLVTFA